VPANASEWSFDPWAGDVSNGHVRGRGAQDMKGQVACEVAAAISLASSGWRPARGELLVVVTADEEMGAAAGAQWLCAEHPEKVRADYVINEGGGPSFEVAGRRFYSLCVGEKGICRFHLRAHGVAGHASTPGVGENALLKLAPALVRLGQQPPPESTPEGVAFLSAVLGDAIDGSDAAAVESAIERLRGLSPQITAYIAEPMLHVTLVPTRARASEKDNVIPSLAEILVDCRVPPGLGPDDVRERVGAVLGPLTGNLELEFAENVMGNVSAPESPLADAISAWLAERDPEATLVPVVMSGFTDSHWFREAFDSAVVYGFHPQRTIGAIDAWPLVHGADEVAAVADLELAASFYVDVTRRVLQ
jgi:acetylornithine deacetylase/succinyl-diaminopimelate desuccinylase-like protein